MENWDDLRFFLAVTQQASLRKAAENLGTSRSTVMRRLNALENALGVRLFERQPDGYFATPAAEDLLRAVERMQAEANAAERRLAGRDAELTGTVRVSVPGALATYVLMPDLALFHRTHPEIRLEILSTYDMPDLARREADVAIRISNDPPQDLVGRNVLSVARAAYGCARRSEATSPAQTDTEQDHPLSWIGWSSAPSLPQRVRDSDLPNLPVNTIITDPYATIAAIRAGIGVSMLPCFMGDVEADLCRVPPGRIQDRTDLWVLTHEDLRNTARIRKFTDFMTDALRRHQDLLEGRRANPSCT